MTLSTGFERSPIIRRLKPKKRSQNFEHGFLGGKDFAIAHRNSNTEPDVETVPQIDVAQVAALDCQPMRFSDGEAGFHHVPTKAVAKLWRQVARGENCGACLDRHLFR